MVLSQVYSHPFIKEPLPPGQILSTVYIIEIVRPSPDKFIELIEELDPLSNAANYVCIMQGGQIKPQGTAEEIKGSSDIREAYLGI
jgi:ABC-type branched-subunit amino acid transport system ATPase component